MFCVQYRSDYLQIIFCFNMNFNIPSGLFLIWVCTFSYRLPALCHLPSSHKHVCKRPYPSLHTLNLNQGKRFTELRYPGGIFYPAVIWNAVFWIRKINVLIQDSRKSHSIHFTQWLHIRYSPCLCWGHGYWWFLSALAFVSVSVYLWLL